MAPDVMARAAPAWLSVPDYAETDGDLAIGQAEQVGIDLDPHQREFLNAVYAVQSNGRPACSQVAIIGPRQTVGKTATLEVAALTDLFVFGVHTHVWTAHLYPTARKSFVRMVSLIDAVDDLRRLCRKPRTANGDEKIQLLTGEALEFHARSKGGGRGFAAVERITLDEGLFLAPAEMGALSPTAVTMPNRQTRIGSSAGLVTSDVLRDIRDRGRSGQAPKLAYMEFAAPRRGCVRPDCSHLAGRVEGCALDDLELYAMANPLGRVEMEALLDQRQELPPAEFAREFYSWWDEPAELVALFGDGRWEACGVKPGSSEIVGEPVYGVAATPDQSWSCIGAAGRNGTGRVHLEPVEHQWRTDWLLDRSVHNSAVNLHERNGGTFVIDGTGPLGALIPDFEEAGLSVIRAKSGDVLDACAQLMLAVIGRQVVHLLGDPDLDAAVAGAQKREIGDRYVWQRKTTIDISPLEAVTLAAWGVGQTSPPPAPPQGAQGTLSPTADLATANF